MLDNVRRKRTPLSLIPLKCTFAEYIVKSNQEYCHEHQHCKKTTCTHRAEIDRVGVEENDFNIKQHEQNSGHQVFDRDGNSCVALTLDPAFKVFVFLFAVAARPKSWYYNEYYRDKSQCYKGLHQNGQVSGRFHM